MFCDDLIRKGNKQKRRELGELYCEVGSMEKLLESLWVMGRKTRCQAFNRSCIHALMK